MSKFSTVKEVAELLRCDRQKIEHLIRSGQLGAVNTASPGARLCRYLVSQEAIDDYLASRATSAPEKPAPRRKKSAAVKQYV